MTALLHKHTSSSVFVIARSSSTYSVVVWLWALLSWPFEFHVWTHSYDPSPQCHVLGRAGSCMQWNLENGRNFVRLKPLPCTGGVTRHVVVVRHPVLFPVFWLFLPKWLLSNVSFLCHKNVIHCLSWRARIMLHHTEVACRRDQLDLMLRSCDL